MKARFIRIVIVLVILGAGWIYKTKFANVPEGGQQADAPKLWQNRNQNDGGSKKPNEPVLKSDWQKSAKTAEVEKVNGYDRLIGCQLVDHRNNDGDSFHIKHAGKVLEIRLYYVDTAEKYLSDRHENQRRRVAEQAEDFGGISIDQVLELGQEAKEFTLDLLEGKTFTVFTQWEEVYDSGRYYAFVEAPGSDGKYLSEYLVAMGLVRLHTKGVPTPDGRNYRQYRDHLNQVERKAKAAKQGAWGL
ncbi:MAG: hypothetical protein HKN23_20715 [Verrucomicrobiales bacterium]|nr:hypothetical protein [Verrucomicrobiales bacterium]